MNNLWITVWMVSVLGSAKISPTHFLPSPPDSSMHVLSLGISAPVNHWDEGCYWFLTELAPSKPNVRFVRVKTVSSPLIFPGSSDKTVSQPQSLADNPNLTDTMILCRFGDFFWWMVTKQGSSKWKIQLVLTECKLKLGKEEERIPQDELKGHCRKTQPWKSSRT